MGSSCSRKDDEPANVNVALGTVGSGYTYNDSNSCLLAVQFESERTIKVLKYHSAKDDWTICHEILNKGLYRTAIVKQYLLFHDWSNGVRVCCYDTTTRALRTLMPLKVRQPYWSCYCATEFQNLLYFIGADTEDTRKVYAWDPEHDALSNVPKLNIGRTRATAVKHEGCLYVVGGMITSLDDISDTQDIASVERYNPRRNCWERCASLLQARCVSGLGSAGHFIYVVGGDCVGTPTNMVERYDSRINKWTQITVMQVPKVFPATVYFNNRLIVCGNSSNDEDCSIVEEFDEKTNKWSIKNKMPLPGPFSYVVTNPEWLRQLEALN
ncbi:kelch-like protein diablo [Ceratitis capitata]|uniref:kelch-like protein diablo n=1 Tax=Ceratitis capitata TaxID=7213 RepID=UPI00032988DF|nr:kelch-like protein diablo [Ceratitis capitata]